MTPFFPSRRQFIALVAASTLAPFRRGSTAAAPLFEQIPSAVSGISWVHENAMSSNRYLPETMGPGVAFFDYDNDGWMDIFMVNSGAADFYKPAVPLKNALYKNNRDGTFTDVTDKAGVAGGQNFGIRTTWSSSIRSRCVIRSPCCYFITTEPNSSTLARRPDRCFSSSSRPAGSLLATTTMTAALMFSSATTAARRCC
jgi:hypothetical protein